MFSAVIHLITEAGFRSISLFCEHWYHSLSGAIASSPLAKQSHSRYLRLPRRYAPRAGQDGQVPVSRRSANEPANDRFKRIFQYIFV